MTIHSFSNINQRKGPHFAEEKRTTQNLVSQLYAYVSEFNTEDRDLARIQRFFDQGEMWPDQCSYAIHIFSKLRRPVRDLNQMMEASPQFSKKTLFNRYSFLVKSCNVESSISDIISRLEGYKEICRSDSDERTREHEEIAYDLEQLSEDYFSLKDMLERIVANVPLPNLPV